MATTLGGRVARALDAADMTVKDLEKALEEEGVKGGSYANLHRLKSNKLDRPSAGLLYGIAKATGVRLPWLVARDGPMTEEEAERPPEKVREIFEEREEKLQRAILEGLFGGDPNSGRVSKHSYGLLVDAFIFAKYRGPGPVPIDSEEEYDLARKVGEAAGAPLRALGGDPASVPADDLDDYLSALDTAFRIADNIISPEKIQ